MTELDSKVPKWATAAFHQMVGQSERLSQTVHLAMKGISFTQNAEKVAELINRIDDNNADAEGRDRLRRAREETELAKREVAQGFPVLHSQAVVTEWAYLEACVRRLVADWIQNEPTCLKNEAFEKVRVRLADYERLDATEKAFFVVDTLERECGAGLQSGVARFEVLLSALGLNGEVPGLLRQRIFELGQVRNIVMHRAGLVDKKFADACPWLKVPIGEALLITHKMYVVYSRAVHDYHMLIICRVAERFGMDVDAERREVVERNTSLASTTGE